VNIGKKSWTEMLMIIMKKAALFIKTSHYKIAVLLFLETALKITIALYHSQVASTMRKAELGCHLSQR